MLKSQHVSVNISVSVFAMRCDVHINVRAKAGS